MRLSRKQGKQIVGSILLGAVLLLAACALARQLWARWITLALLLVGLVLAGSGMVRFYHFARCPRCKKFMGFRIPWPWSYHSMFCSICGGLIDYEDDD